MDSRKEGEMGRERGIVGEETSPDMLKNTPSNIRRLADEIEQCEGRHKYLAQTTSSSDGGDVRWYFCKTPMPENELAASVPGTEIVGKGDYFRFGMRDSLAIEASFLQREEELLSSWWKEYSECSEGPKGHSSATTFKSTIKQSDGERTPLRSSSANLLYSFEEERVGVPVKGGLYEVDLVKRHCFPVYWDGENRRVLRGQWFARKGGLDWLPLREDVAEQLEFAYRSRVWNRRTFQPSGLFAARVDLQGSAPGLHALFTGEDGTWEAWLIVDPSAFSNVISLGGKGIKLRRGYASSPSSKPTQDELRQKMEEEIDDYCSQVPVQHLVFMVHGIGQRLEKSNLVDDVGNFRHITASLSERHLTPYQRGTQRVLYIPCQWRRGLKLSGEAAVDRITLDGVRGLRTMLSATVHDVLYYMSPIYCQDIINSVSHQLNRLYLKFLKRNPGYDGKVSLYGHSLGSVLSYDILCHQETLSSPFPMQWMYKEHDMNDKSNDAHLSDLDHDKRKSISMESDIDESSSINALADSQETCVPDDPPSSSDSDELPPTKNTQPNDDVLLSEETLPGHSLDWSDPISFESKGGTQESPSIITAGVDDDHDDSGKKKIDDSDKDKRIKLLTREIDLLKHKLTNLESETGSRGYGKRSATTPSEIVREDTPEQSYTPYINYTKLLFKVDTYFAVGSPLGVFLSLRNIRLGTGNGKDYWEGENINEEMPACRQMFNIFHPFDPVAYRIEPLICKEYLGKRPVIIPYHRGGKRLHIGFQEFTEGLASHSQAFMGHISSIRVRVLTLCESRDNKAEDEATESFQEEKERSYGSLMLEKLTGSEDGRLDHVLQDKTFRHPYVSAIGAHTNYWRDYDTALFILKHLYKDIPEDPPSPSIEDDNTSTSSKGGGGGGWYDHTHLTHDEELPLTFADKLSVNNFSRIVKKAMKKP